MPTKQQSIDTSDQLIEEVNAYRLPDRVSELVASYGTTIGDRDRFLWKWLHCMVPKIRLSCVDPASVEHVRDTKVIASMFIVLLDDLAEKHRDRVTFEEAAKITLSVRASERRADWGGYQLSGVRQRGLGPTRRCDTRWY